MSRNLRSRLSSHLFGRKAETQAWLICILGTIGRTATMAKLPPGTRRRPLDPGLALSHESRNQKRSLARCPLAPPRVSANGERRRSARENNPLREATTQSECSYVACAEARPISCSDCPVFQRLQTSRFSIAESPNLFPRLMSTPPPKSRFTSDGVASTYRMHRPYRDK